MTSPELRPVDRSMLRIFRQVAAEARAAQTADKPSFADVKVVNGYIQSDGEQQRIRNLCIPVRRTYLKNDPVNMKRVLSLIEEKGSPELQERVRQLDEGYAPIQQELESASILNERRVTHAEMFEAWIDAMVFYDIPDKCRPFVQMANELGKAVEGIGLHLAERMMVVLLEADDIVADFLGEPRGTMPPPAGG